MVHGLDVFKEYFKFFTDEYVVIGGTACTVLLNALGADFRATHDIDLVLLAKHLSPEFGQAFWQFIADGGYSTYTTQAGYTSFYRFTHPKNTNFPKMIELFSRDEKKIYNADVQHIPLHISSEVESPSAILPDKA